MFDAIVRSPTPSLRGAKRRGNLPYPARYEIASTLRSSLSILRSRATADDGSLRSQ